MWAGRNSSENRCHFRNVPSRCQGSKHNKLCLSCNLGLSKPLRPGRPRWGERPMPTRHYNADHVFCAWPSPLRRGGRSRGLRPRPRPRIPRSLPFHPGDTADDVSRTPLDDASVCRVRECGRVEPAVSLSALARASAGLSVAFDLPTQIGYDSDARARRGRGGTGWRGHRLHRGHGGAVRRHPARPRVDVDDHQRHRDHPAGAVCGRRRSVRACRPDSFPAPCRTTFSRSMSPAAPTSTRRGHSLRIVTDIFAFCEREVPQWNTISISGYHIREAGSTAVQEVAFTLRERHCLRRRPASTRASTSTRSGSGCRSSSMRTTTSWRRSRSSGPPGGCGRG